MRIFRGCVFLLLCCCLSLQAEVIDSATYLLYPKVNDTTVHVKRDFSKLDFCNCNNDQLAPIVTQREVNTSELEAQLKKREFQYERTVKDEANSFWNNFWRWLANKLFGKINEENAIRTRNIVYTVISIFGVIMVGYWLYKSEFLGTPLRRTSKVSDGLFSETARSEEDLDAQIVSALQQENFPLAIRWVYIKCIKILAANRQIEIKQDKTNYDYFLEIGNKDIRAPFGKLTQLFEYTNYGNFESNIHHYHQAVDLVKNINNSVA